jgi:hypothetical protein
MVIVDKNAGLVCRFLVWSLHHKLCCLFCGEHLLRQLSCLLKHVKLITSFRSLFFGKVIIYPFLLSSAIGHIDLLRKFVHHIHLKRFEL